MSRGDLSEPEWRLQRDLLPPERGCKCRPASDDRPIVNGILWRIRTVIPPRSNRKAPIRWSRRFHASATASSA